MAFSDRIKKYTGENPFSDSQPRNFSDKKVLSEFYPISNYWSLFNDQHEILIGSRGSGKTFLLKMMRYSLLKRVNDERAIRLIKEKKYIAVYIPMHLEFVAPFNNCSLSSDEQIVLFQIAFNCFLAEALMTELRSIIDDIEDKGERIYKQLKLVTKLYEMWFSEKGDVCDFDMLSEKIQKIYYSMDWSTPNNKDVPPIFKRQIGASLLAVKDIITNVLEFKEEPTWIVCVDEAEFLNETLQKCINNVFRSDSNRLTLKVATLPFYHTTLETLVPGIVVSNGNDFSYRNVDMTFDGQDFIELTNKLCEHRLYERFDSKMICHSVEDFVGSVGKDDAIAYYRYEIGDCEATSQEEIKKKIIEDFPPKRRKNAPNYSNDRKSIYDKYAPIFFLREMYKLSCEGNHKPGWYAGAKTVRRVSQGNPRMFIQVMGALFDVARNKKLTPKVQHEVILKFAESICKATKALEVEGPLAYKNITTIANTIKKKVHGEYLLSQGYTFKIKYKSDEDFGENLKWIQLAIAYSRLVVDEDTKKNGISIETTFNLSNAFAIAYWIPMRNDAPTLINLEKEDNSYKVSAPKNVEYHQLSLFEENIQ